MAKTVSYTYVIQKACELTGRVYPPTTEEASFFRTFIGTAIRQAWEAFDWPEQTVTQQEFFALDYSSSSTYAYGEVIYFPTEQKYYQCVLSTGISGIDPTTGGPNGTLNSGFWAEAKDSYVGAAGGTWNSTSSYSIGDIVLYAVDQQYYQCVAQPTPGTAPSNVTFWGELIPFFRRVNQQTFPGGATRTNELGEIFAVYQQDPRVRAVQTRNVSYTFEPSGLLILDALPYVWIEARLLPQIGRAHV